MQVGSLLVLCVILLFFQSSQLLILQHSPCQAAPRSPGLYPRGVHLSASKSAISDSPPPNRRQECVCVRTVCEQFLPMCVTMGDISDLDRQIEQLRRCELIKENEVKALCAKAR